MESGRSREKCLVFRNQKRAKGKKPRKMDCDPGINVKCGRQEFWNPFSLVYLESGNQPEDEFQYSQAAAAGHHFNP